MLNLVLDVKEIELILIHLGKGEYAQVALLIDKIKQQATTQIDALQKKAAEAKEDTKPSETEPA